MLAKTLNLKATLKQALEPFLPKNLQLSEQYHDLNAKMLVAKSSIENKIHVLRYKRKFKKYRKKRQY